MNLISPHFSNSELKCHGTTCSLIIPGTPCNLNNVQQILLDALEQFRLTSGSKSIILDDAYRCAVHNKQVGGVPNSEHVQGIAADLRIEGMTGAELEAIALKCPLITAIGRDDYRNYIHIDTRPMSRGHALWCYAESGTWEPYYSPKSTGVLA
jgi:hypothetical protein